jgi:outer membrane protein TolC
MALADLATLERARFWPDLAIVGFARVAAAQGVDNPPSAFANDPFNTAAAGVGLALQWTLDPLAQRGRLARANAEAGRAAELATAAADGVELEVRQAYNEAQQAHERLTAAREGEKAARAWVASVLQASAVGTAESKDLADAYIAYFTIRSRVLTAIFEWNVATWRLRRATGEFMVPRVRP